MFALNCCRSLLYVQRMSKTKSTLFGFVTGTIGEAPYRDQCNPVLSILSSSFRCKTNKGVGLRGKVSIFFVQGCLGAILVCVSALKQLLGCFLIAHLEKRFTELICRAVQNYTIPNTLPQTCKLFKRISLAKRERLHSHPKREERVKFCFPKRSCTLQALL